MQGINFKKTKFWSRLLVQIILEFRNRVRRSSFFPQHFSVVLKHLKHYLSTNIKMSDGKNILRLFKMLLEQRLNLSWCIKIWNRWICWCYVFFPPIISFLVIYVSTTHGINKHSEISFLSYSSIKNPLKAFTGQRSRLHLKLYKLDFHAYEWWTLSTDGQGCNVMSFGKKKKRNI